MRAFKKRNCLQSQRGLSWPVKFLGRTHIVLDVPQAFFEVMRHAARYFHRNNSAKVNHFGEGRTFIGDLVLNQKRERVFRTLDHLTTTHKAICYNYTGILDRGEHIVIHYEPEDLDVLRKFRIALQKLGIRFRRTPSNLKPYYDVILGKIDSKSFKRCCNRYRPKHLCFVFPSASVFMKRDKIEQLHTSKFRFTS